VDSEGHIPEALRPLIPAEQNLLSSLMSNCEVDWRTGDPVTDDPKNFRDWKPDHVIRASFFQWLCTDAIEVHKVIAGIKLSGIHIRGRPNLSYREIPISLTLQQCAIPTGIDLVGANCRMLDFSGTYLGSISANSMSASSLSVRSKATLIGTFDLRSAKIGGDLDLTASLFNNPRGVAILATQITVGGSVRLANSFRANGSVNFISAHVSGDLVCDACQFWNPGGIAFHGDSMVVEKRGFFRKGFLAVGEVRLVATRFGRLLDCGSAYFRNKRGAALSADMIITGGGAFFRGSHFKGMLRLSNASIQGVLDLTAGRFEAPRETAVLCDSANIQGSVLCACECTGAISFIGATIGGDLDCEKGVFVRPDGYCFNAAGATIKGRLFLRFSFQAVGQVNLMGASVGNVVDCSRGTFTAGTRLAGRGSEVAATFERLSCGSINLNGARIDGHLSAWGATIRGDLDLRGAHIIASSPQQVALNANWVQIDGSLRCNKDTRLIGALKIVTSQIKGDLWCEELEFGSHQSKTIDAAGVRVFGRALLSRSHFRGAVNFSGASLDNSFICNGTEFDSPNGQCLNMSDAIVKGGVFLRSAVIRGRAVLVRVQVTGDIECMSTTFRNPGGVALDLSGGKVGGTLVWRELAAEPGEIDLRNLHIAALNDDAESWLNRNVVHLHGMTYDSIHESRVSARDRVRWLQKQKNFSPQPYEMLIRVLRNMGHDQDARIIGIAKMRGLRNSGELRGWAWSLNWLLDKLVGFGYQPAKPIVSLLALIVIGACVFSWARNEAVLCPADFVTKQPEKLTLQSCSKPLYYPEFEPVLYSIGVIVPAIDFHQKKYWEMRSDTPRSGFFQLYSWVHMALGWLFSLLAALSPTKLLRRE
jgi:hypothetical protein